LEIADLVIGFREYDQENYCRFPLYLCSLISPEMTPQQVELVCKQINRRDDVIRQQRKKFCTLIARHDDKYRLRSKTCNVLSSIEKVDCPSTVCHNMNVDIPTYDDKRAFLRHYKFNLCPENTAFS
jgi:hypothetical protein